MSLYTDVLVTLRFRCFKRGEFTLASGKISDVYFNCKPAITDPKVLLGIIELMDHKLAVRSDDFRAFAAVPLGGIPLATALSLRRMKPLVLVRSSMKDHGSSQRVESCGVHDHNPQVILVEDVVTTAGSVMNAVEALKAARFSTTGVLSIIDREEGGRERIESAGIWYDSLYRRRDFV